ncbi:hypothetical protein BGZ98_000149 [Dissophora globulifera]|nr:hypothetical protein BGZ98_000149 [Dissophora globulifera]
MDPQQPARAHDPSNRIVSSGKGKEPSSISGVGASSPESGSQSTGGSMGLLGSVAASARNMASALDPRQPDLVRQHHSFGSTLPGGTVSGSAVTGSGSKAESSSTASRMFQHTTNALDTIGSSNSGSIAESTDQQPSFRGGFSSSTSQQEPATGERMMDWDNFLASSESTIEDSQPYRPPAMSSFDFPTFVPTDQDTLRQRQTTTRELPPLHLHDPPTYQQQRLQGAALSSFDSVYNAHLSQPMNLTPANHAAFLEYLKSTADRAQSQSSESAATSHMPASTTQQLHSHQQSSQHQQHPHPQPQPQYSHHNRMQLTATEPGLFSHDIKRQQHLDGSDVLAFLDSTSYSDFVDQVEAGGIEKHQQERREFVYSEAVLGSGSQSLFSTLQMIQHLPSERQDIVEYLMRQGTYTEDVWSRPFGHDAEREEAASMAASRAEQDLFLQQQQQQQHQQNSEAGESLTTEEMERVLNQIVEEAKAEVKTGETNGKALNRLMMVRSHITMGTKL